MILLINMNEYTIEDVTVGMIFPIYPGRKIQVLMWICCQDSMGLSDSVGVPQWPSHHGF